MVNVVKGVLLKCDPAMKQYLLHLDEKRTLGDTFILQDLDSTHLFIQGEYIERIQEEIDQLMNQNSFALGHHQQ